MTDEDELITRISMDTKSVEAGEKKVVEATRHIDEAFKHTLEKSKEFGERLGERLKVGELFGPIAALATVTGLVELGKDAYETANKFDVLERKLAGVTRSYARAKQLESGAEKAASRTGLFNVEQLEEAELALEKFGLRAEKYLPIVQALGAVSGEGLEALADAFGRMAGGDAGRALMILERAGVSRNDMIRHGVRFNGRELAGRPEQAIPGIMAAAQEKFGPVLDEMVNSPEAKARRLEVSWEAVLRRMGQAVQTILGPAFEGIADGLQGIAEDGKLDAIATKFAALFSLDGSNLKEIVHSVADAIETAPDRIKDLIERFREWLPVIEQGGAMLAGMWAGTKVAAFSAAVVEAFEAIKAAELSAAGAAALFEGLTGNIATVIAGGMAAVGTYELLRSKLDETNKKAQEVNKGIGSAYVSAERLALIRKVLDLQQEIASTKHDIEGDKRYLPDRVPKDEAKLKRLEEELKNARIESETQDTKSDETVQREAAEKALKEAQARLDRDRKLKRVQEIGKDEDAVKTAQARLDDAIRAEKNLPSANETAEQQGAAQQVVTNNYLYQIAQNTGELVREMKRYAFGGGDLGRLGVAPVDLHAKGSGAARRLGIALNEYLGSEIASALGGAVRGGYLGRH